MILLAPILLLFFGILAVMVVGQKYIQVVAPLSIAVAAASFGILVVIWQQGGAQVDLNWLPEWNIYLRFHMDGLGAFYAILANGVGLVILFYSSRYIDAHLEREKRPQKDKTRFFALLLFFMASMVSLALAQDLLLFFFIWDFTTVASYLLIGYDHEKPEARQAALMALLVTGITSVFLLISALLLYSQYQTFSIPVLLANASIEPVTQAALILIVITAVAKSAQVPFHIWLPRAMQAPTPVSAYLHSAAMVAAGVLLMQRMYPLIVQNTVVLDLILGFGLLSMIIASLLALTQNVLKRILAYSTIAQYGYMVYMLGLGTQSAYIAVSFYVLAHALIKSALFLSAGAVMEATDDEKDITRLGGLWRSKPVLAVSTGIHAAALAGLPLTVGYFKDDLFFRTAWERGWPYAAFAVLGATLTLAYIWRYWQGIFLGPKQKEDHAIPSDLVAPVAFFAALVFAGGIFTGPFTRLAETAAQHIRQTNSTATLAPLHYPLQFRSETIMALLVFLLGFLVILTRPYWVRGVKDFANAGSQAGPDKVYRVFLKWLNSFSNQLYRFESDSLAGRLITLLIPSGILMLLGLFFTPTEGLYRFGSLSWKNLPLFTAVILAAFAGWTVSQPRSHLT